MRGPAGVLLAALALSACASTPERPGHCKIAPVATLSLSAEPHVVVDGELSRQPARFILDTGADGSAVASWAPAAYHLQRLRNDTRLNGTGGLVIAETASGRIGLGGDEVWRHLPVVDFPSRPRQGAPYAGLLGTDVLAAYDLEISFPEHRVRLWQTQDCRGRYALWGGDYWSLPLEPGSNGMLRTTVSVDGQPLRALLDTGAGISVVRQAKAEELGVTPAMLAADPARTSSGIDGKPMPASVHRFREVRIGPETVPPLLPVSDIWAPRADMLLGADWMQHRRVWISWASKQVFVQHEADIRPPAPGSPGAALP